MGHYLGPAEESEQTPGAAIENASGVTFGQLRPHEKRAVELLCGVKNVSLRRIQFEEMAIGLEDAVRREWFTPPRDAGRPKGSLSQKIENTKFGYRVPLSIAEIISVAKPIIEDFAGVTITPSISKPGPASSAFEALVAAVQVVTPGCSPESIIAIMTREKV